MIDCTEPVDADFLSAFEACTLPESEWTHAAHIKVAWICLNQQSPELALDRIRSGILRYNTEVLNRRDKYHETVTVAFTHIVASRIRKDETWADFAMRINDILDPEEPILLRYYSKDRLFSENARNEYVEPDLQEFPPPSDN